MYVPSPADDLAELQKLMVAALQQQQNEHEQGAGLSQATDASLTAPSMASPAKDTVVSELPPQETISAKPAENAAVTDVPAGDAAASELPPQTTDSAKHVSSKDASDVTAGDAAAAEVPHHKPVPAEPESSDEDTDVAVAAAAAIAKKERFDKKKLDKKKFNSKHVISGVKGQTKVEAVGEFKKEISRDLTHEIKELRNDLGRAKSPGIISGVNGFFRSVGDNVRRGWGNLGAVFTGGEWPQGRRGRAAQGVRTASASGRTQTYHYVTDEQRHASASRRIGAAKS